MPRSKNAENNKTREIRVRDIPEKTYWLFKSLVAEKRTGTSARLVELIEEDVRRCGGGAP